MTPQPTPVVIPDISDQTIPDDKLAIQAIGMISAEPEIASAVIQRPNRWIRRALLKQPGTARVPSPTAAARRQATRRIAKRSRVRNRR